MKNLIDVTEEYISTGPEWMLQDGKVPDRVLIQALLEEDYLWIYQACFECMEDGFLAQQAAIDSLAQVVAERQKYWEQIPFEDWIGKRAVDSLLALSRAKWMKRGLSGFHSEELLKSDELAGAIEQLALWHRKKRIKTRFKRVFGLLMGVLSISAALVIWAANPDLSDLLPYSQWFTYRYEVKTGDSLQSIAERAGVSTEELRKLNPNTDFKSLHIGIELILPAKKPCPSDLQEIGYMLKCLQRKNMLTPQSGEEEIKQSILQNNKSWFTLEASYWLTVYNIPGYISATPFRQRSKIWLQQPDKAVLLVEGQNKPPVVSYNIGNQTFEFKFPNDGNYLKGEFLEEKDVRGEYPFWDYITGIRQQLSKEGHISVIGDTQISGREALLIDWINKTGERIYRLWIDKERGVFLGFQEYGGRDYQWPLWNLVTSEIQFDREIPVETFNPENFGSDKLGWQKSLEPAPPEMVDKYTTPASLVQPPDGFDASKSRITIAWPSNQKEDVLVGFTQPHQSVRVYGDQFYLGSLDYPLSLESFYGCSRSFDGRIVAINTGEKGTTYLEWFPVDNPGNLQPVVDYDSFQFYGEFAFSPDSQQIAFFSCTRQGNNCGIYISNLEAENMFELVKVNESVDWLFWSPDGKQVGFVKTQSINNSEKRQAELVIYSVENKQQVFYSRYDPIEEGLPAGTPVERWGIDTYGALSSKAGCSSP